MRAVMIAVCAAVIAGPVEAQTRDEMVALADWAKHNLEAKGWGLLGYGAGVVMFGRRLDASKVWVRFENQEDESGLLSEVQLMETDCEGARLRPLQRIGYEGRNLEGDSMTLARGGEWTYPVPNSMATLVLEWACGS